MKSILLPLEQIKSILPSIVLVAMVSFFVLGSVLGLHLYYDIPLRLLTSDIASAANEPIYIGVQSQIGIFFWAATAAICFYSSKLVSSKTNKNFLFASGLVSLFLGLDDVFMFHELIFPSLGIHQKIVFLSYAVFMLFYGFKFLKILLTTDYVLFALAIGFFGISLLIDNVFYESKSEYVKQLVEDGAKFIGIVFWTTFFYRTNIKMVRDEMN